MTVTRMKLEVGKYYRTRGGDKVQIIAHDPAKEYPWLGTYISNNPIWESYSYNSNGFWKDNCCYERDLIAEWSDPVELSEPLPTWNWLAMDENGAWYMFVEKPKLDRGAWITDRSCVRTSAPKNFTGSYKDSLFRIVDGKLVKEPNK